MSKTPDERKAYMRELMAKKRAANKLLTDSANKPEEKLTKPVSKTEAVNKPEKVPVHYFDEKLFDGKGRGVPVDGYVMIDKVGIVHKTTWLARLNTICVHGLAGWSCKVC